jgi:hypothetical protein
MTIIKANLILFNPNKSCCCGKEIESHKPSVLKTFRENGPTQKIWDEENCTVDDGETDAYGEIVFQGASDSLSKVNFNSPVWKCFEKKIYSNF